MVRLPNGMRVMQWRRAETRFLYNEIFRECTYDRDGHIVFKPGDVVIDSGANIGMFSLFAAGRCRGHATIYSFEPVPATHAILAANAEMANRGEFDSFFGAQPGSRLTIKAMNYGLSDTVSEVTFDHLPKFSIWSTGDPEMTAQRENRILRDSPSEIPWLPAPVVRFLSRKILSRMNTTVKVRAKLIPLSAFIDEHGLQRIDVLKIDVEGAEIPVLHGIEARHWGVIRQVAMEVESFEKRDQVVGILRAHGFETACYASERERRPESLSEVSMVYAWRP